MRLRRLLFVVVVAAAVSAGAWFAFLRPSSEAIRAAPAHGALLVAPARRRAMADLWGSALSPPPARLFLRARDHRPQLVDVWASWCVPCREEAPMLASLAREYGRKIRFLGINVEDTRGAAKAFERRYGISFPSIFDPKASMAGTLGFFGIPTAYFVDRSGRIAATAVGKQTRAALVNRLELLLRERVR